MSAQPRLHQRAREIQAYGTVNHALPVDLEEPVRVQITNQLNQLLADTRDILRETMTFDIRHVSPVEVSSALLSLSRG